MDDQSLVKQLVYQIRLGEDSSYEFKEVLTNKNGKLDAPTQSTIAKELVAFANSRGGHLILGVRDKLDDQGVRKVTGIEPELVAPLQDRINAACRDTSQPALIPYVRIVEVPDHEGVQRVVIYIELTRSLFVHSAGGRYYHRVNESCAEMSQQYLQRLMQQRSQSGLISYDEQPVPGTSKDDLDEALGRRFLRGNQPEQLQYQKLKLVTRDLDDVEHLSIAGVLMATHEPRQWLGHAFIQAVAYSGDTRDANQQLDAKDISGTLDQQVKLALQFVERNMRTSATKNVGRADKPQYSLRAVFEALVNAVAHRDYAIADSKIRLHIFVDRLVIASPGSLANSLEVDDLELRQVTRNDLIASLLARCPVDAEAVERAMIMDRRGEGVPVIMNDSEALSGRRPSYELVGEELQLTIYAASSGDPERD